MITFEKHCTQIVKSKKIGREIKKGVDGISGPNHLANLRTKVFPAALTSKNTVARSLMKSHLQGLTFSPNIFLFLKSVLKVQFK